MAPIGIAMEAVKASQVSLKRLIMEGSVGRLYYGTLTNDSGDIQYPILAKTINGEMSDVEFQLFLSDVYSLKGCCHGNIQPMLCCVLEPLHRPVVVYRFSNDCNLKIYLRTCRASQLLSSVQMLQMIMGICDGLCFLHGRMIVHKDVASRNCLVDDCLTVRLTDAALSSDFFPEDYYLSPADGNPVPVRWLPTETLENCVYDMTSEVWSFGVTAWEVLTYGQQPYSEFGSNEILRELRSGYRLPLPSCCSEEIYQLLADCWQSLPDARPSLPLVYRSIEEICATLGHFV